MPALYKIIHDEQKNALPSSFIGGDPAVVYGQIHSDFFCFFS